MLAQANLGEYKVNTSQIHEQLGKWGGKTLNNYFCALNINTQVHTNK